mgnify:CR=1 FL=1
MFRLAAPALAALALSASLAPAATLGGHTSFFVFGDSLSDPGNLYAATGGTVPASPPYWNGRFSNGPTWAEDVAADFTAKGLATGNFAFGKANAIPDADPIPDLPTQIGLFDATVPAAALGSSPLAAIWIGANDLFGALDAGLDTAGVVATAIAAARAEAASIAALATRGITDFVVLNLADIGTTPWYTLIEPGKAASATAGAEAFNAELADQLALLRKTGLDVTAIDTHALFEELQADPAAFGLADATTPCLIPGVKLCSTEEADKLAFFDLVHPTKQIHSRIAEIVENALEPAAVPLPASAPLLAGALGLLTLRRRRAA